MTASNAAHLFGALLLTAGLPARLKGRVVLSWVLLFSGMVVAHLPDLG